MTVPQRAEMNDYCANALLGRFRKNSQAGCQFERPRVDRRDIEDLLCRWALSDDVGKLALHLLEYPRDARSSIDFVETITQGEIIGTIDARATMAEQTRNGDSTLFVVQEPSSSYANGPNHLIAWTLREAEGTLVALLRRERPSPDLAWIYERAQLLERALRNHMLREALIYPQAKSRPGLSALRSAARSRAAIYRLALTAFEKYERVEALEQVAIRDLLQQTLLAPLENWQILELSTALSAAEALADASGVVAAFRFSVGSDRVVAEAGKFEVHWQRALKPRGAEKLDPCEALAKRLAQSIGADTASSRVDVSIVDRSSGNEVAHCECKWFESETSAASAVSDACVQITRYAMDSRPDSIGEAENMLKDCLVVVASRAKFSECVDGNGPVGFTDFAGLINRDTLANWAAALMKHHSPACT